MKILPLDAKEDNLTIEATAPAIGADISVNIAQVAQVEQLEQDIDHQPSALAKSSVNHPPNLLPNILSAEVGGLSLAHSKIKGDCLYLYSQDRKPSCAKQILEAIAPSTQNLENSILFAEGIRRLKLHGAGWALGVDLPVAAAAIAAAHIIKDLRKQFHGRSSANYAALKLKLKLLLQNNCLNLLCETAQPTLQAEIALPILETLRNVQAAAYFQSVTVSNRVTGEQRPHWSFEIDLLAIGTATDPKTEQSGADHRQIETSSASEVATNFNNSDIATAQVAVSLKQLVYTSLSKIGDRLLTTTRPLWSLRWLGSIQHSPDVKFNAQTNIKLVNAPWGLLSIAIGLGCTITIDRLLSQHLSANLIKGSDNSINSLALNSPTANITDVPNPTGIDPNTLKVQDKPKANFNISSLNEKIALIDWQTTKKQQSPDVLIVGSSRALRGINPSALEQALKQQGYQNISVFNFGLDGATAQVVNIQLTQILETYQLPKMIIWADGLRAFNSRRKDTTYEEITASVGYQQLQTNLQNKGIDPQPIPNTTTTTKPDSPFSRAFSSIFSTASQRQEIRNSIITSFNQHTQALSNSESLIAATIPKTAPVLDEKGFISFDVSFDPNTYFLKYPQVPGDYDLDYRDFATDGTQFDALNNIMEFCQRRNIHLVIVNMPLHDTYLDSPRLSQESIFNQHMQQLAQRNNFTYLNLSQSISGQANLFSDPSHLNKDGAIAIAQNLAQHPKMPWQLFKNQK